MRVTGIPSPATCDAKGPSRSPSRHVLAALEPQLRGTLAGTSDARQERNTKKTAPLHRQLRILTRSGCRLFVRAVGSVIKKRRKKMRKHKKKKLLKRSRHKRK